MNLGKSKNLPHIDFLRFIESYNIFFTFIIMIIVASLMSKGAFIQPSNLQNILIRSSVLGIVSIGQALVILTAGIDLSVGAMMGLVFCIMGKSLQAGLSVPTTLIIGILVGIICGFINGLIVSRTVLPPFIITLATSMIFLSLGEFLVGGRSLSFKVIQDYIYNLINYNRVISRVLPVIIWILFTIIVTLLLKYTKTGNNIYAIGANEKASRYSGVNTRNNKSIVYVLSGFFSAIAAIVMMYQLGGANPVDGKPFLLMSVAAVIIGGVNLFGGEGEVIGTIIGVIVVTSLFNLMNLIGVNPYTQDAVAGLIVLFFVFILGYLRNIRVVKMAKEKL